MVFRHVDPSTGQSDGPTGKPVSHLHVQELSEPFRKRIWLSMNYAHLIERQQQKLNRNQRQTCEFLGELNVMDQEGQRHFVWNPTLGARTYQ